MDAHKRRKVNLKTTHKQLKFAGLGVTFGFPPRIRAPVGTPPVAVCLGGNLSGVNRGEGGHGV